MITMAKLMERSAVGFGTSGARGLVEAMTDEVCYLYTVAFLQYLQRDGQIERGCRVAVAGDLRPSTPGIVSAVIRAIRSQGYQVCYCGAVPSPAVALLGVTERIPAIMVTGSHIPDDRNGIKFNKPAGEILKADEQAIKAQVLELPEGLFDESGCFIDSEPLPEIDPVGRTLYLKRFLDLLSEDCLKGCKVGVYEHSSVAREFLVEVLDAAGADVVKLGYSERFIPVDTEAIRREDIDLARRWAYEHRLDALVSTDGDGDRPLISDEKGEWLRGDIAGILVADYLQADVVVTPVSSNSAVEKCGWFNEVIRTRIGSPYVIEAMEQALARYSGGVVGYEANGGFLQASPLELNGRTLQPLATRDALIVIVSILLMSREKGEPVSKLVSQLPKRYTYSGRVEKFPVEISQKRVAQLSSGDMQADAEQFVRFFSDRLGKVTAVDYTDGVRFTLDNQEVVHLRPSGNAPELRCYTEAGSQERAEEINRFCLSVMEGWKSGISTVS